MVANDFSVPNHLASSYICFYDSTMLFSYCSFLFNLKLFKIKKIPNLIVTKQAVTNVRDRTEISNFSQSIQPQSEVK